MQILSAYVKPDFNLHEHPGYVYLTTHNNKADHINKQSLDNLKEKYIAIQLKQKETFRKNVSNG